MRISLKEAMRSAEDGCIKDRDEIIKILTNFLALQTKNFPKDVREDIHNLLTFAHEWMENISDKEFGEFTYLDLICLSEIGIENLAENDTEKYNCLSLYSETLLIQILNKLYSYNKWASLFGSISIAELLNVLDDLAKKSHKSYSELLKITDRLSEHWNKYEITPKTTVKELMRQTESVIKQFWRPWHDLNSFSDNVRVGYDVMNLIAFKCIKLAVPKPFRLWRKESDRRKMLNW